MTLEERKIIGSFMGIPACSVNINTKNLMEVRRELHERTDMNIRMDKGSISVFKGKKEILSTTFGTGRTEVEALTFAITLAINASAV